MKDSTKFTYVCPSVENISLNNEDIVCTSSNLRSADETLTAASWKQSWTEKMGMGE